MWAGSRVCFREFVVAAAVSVLPPCSSASPAPHTTRLGLRRAEGRGSERGSRTPELRHEGSSCDTISRDSSMAMCAIGSRYSGALKGFVLCCSYSQHDNRAKRAGRTADVDGMRAFVWRKTSRSFAVIGDVIMKASEVVVFQHIRPTVLGCLLTVWTRTHVMPKIENIVSWWCQCPVGGSYGRFV